MMMMTMMMTMVVNEDTSPLDVRQLSSRCLKTLSLMRKEIKEMTSPLNEKGVYQNTKTTRKILSICPSLEDLRGMPPGKVRSLACHQIHHHSHPTFTNWHHCLQRLHNHHSCHCPPCR